MGEPLSRSVLESESQLIERIRNGEEELFHQLIQPHERSVYLTARSILENQADAEEVAQEALLKAWRCLDQFRGQSKFSTWLIRIVINEAGMRRRKNRRQPLLESIEFQDKDGNSESREFADEREIPSDTLERKELEAALMRALQSLREPYRKVFWLRDVQQLSTLETGQLLGISSSIVKTRIHRARLQMREQLAPLFRLRGIDRIPFFGRKTQWSVLQTAPEFAHARSF